MLLEALLAQFLNQSAAPPTAATAAAPPRADAQAACPGDMRLVEGIHYENIQRLCLDFRAGHCFSFFPGLMAEEPRVTLIRTCMDTYEWPNKKGASPVVMLRFVEAEAACASVGKRLCTEFEWELACEGPNALPWPYGYRYEVGACNSDKPYMAYSQTKLSSKIDEVREAETKRLYQAEPSGSFATCTSPYGVVDMTGNAEEWVATSRPEWPHRSSLKGGYWSKPWSGCRGTNESHGPMFRFYDIGFRCCQDPKGG